MPAYRLYRVDGDGRISGSEWLAADNDEDAITYVRKRFTGSPRELWHHERLVARFDPRRGAVVY
jgi:hypothetical protein